MLDPGDVIVTGTPPGVGVGKKPPRFLKPGDTMRLGIEGLGEQACRVVARGRGRKLSSCERSDAAIQSRIGPGSLRFAP